MPASVTTNNIKMARKKSIVKSTYSECPDVLYIFKTRSLKIDLQQYSSAGLLPDCKLVTVTC
jgi:hypothetical protein